MVTGIETAGLVLAVFPIVVEGLKVYLDGISSIKKYWQFIAVLKRLIRDLLVEEVKFSNTCTELLHDLVDSSELVRLLEKPGGERWRTTELQIKLKERLGRGLQAYMGAVIDMTDCLEDFRRKLELGPNNRVQWLDHKAHKREWKRVKLSLCEGSNERLLRRLSKNNTDLETLLGQSLRLESARQAPKSSHHARRFEKVRWHAQTIHNALRKSLTQACGCAVPHHANLELQARTSSKTADGKTFSDLDSLVFHVLCYFEAAPTPGQTLPWNWQETMIEPFLQSSAAAATPTIQAAVSSEVDARMTPNTAVPTTSSGPSSPFSRALKVFQPNANALSPNARYVSKKRSKVSFSLPEDLTVPASLSANTSSSSVDSQAIPVQMQNIEDLCGAMHSNAEQISCLGLLLDHEANQHRVSLREGTLPLSPSLKIISLKKLLSQALKIAKRDRLILGVKLASSVLQLYQTPWLKDVWSKSDIFFVQHESHGGKTFISKPFVSKAFNSPVCKINARVATEPYTNPASDVRNQTLFSLGIVLIELWYGQTLETLRIPADLGANNLPSQLTDFATARRLTEEIYDEAGEWYGDAVRRCIYCEFDQRNTSLDTDGMKEAVYSGVINPLQENLTSFCGGQLHDVLK